MSEENIFDIAIIGSGMSGSYLAYQLSRKNKKWKILILESKKASSPKVCGEYLCPAGHFLLKETVPEIDLSSFLPLRGMKVFFHAKKILEGSFFHYQSLGGLSVKRGVIENQLVSLACKANEKNLLMENTKLTDFVKEENSYLLITENGNFKSRRLVAADGRVSFVGSKMNHKKIENKKKKIALHAHLKFKKEMFVNEDRFGEIHLLEEGIYIGLNPVSNKKVNFSVTIPVKKYLAYENNEKKLVMDFIEKTSLENRFDFTNFNFHFSKTYPISSINKKAVLGDVAFVGDAGGGIIDPLTGEGMFNALTMSFFLAKEISAEVIKDDVLWKKSIDSYNKKQLRFFFWKKKFDLFLQFGIKTSILPFIILKLISLTEKGSDFFISYIGNIKKIKYLKKII